MQTDFSCTQGIESNANPQHAHIHQPGKRKSRVIRQILGADESAVLESRRIIPPIHHLRAHHPQSPARWTPLTSEKTLISLFSAPLRLFLIPRELLTKRIVLLDGIHPLNDSADTLPIPFPRAIGLTT